MTSQQDPRAYTPMLPDGLSACAIRKWALQGSQVTAPTPNPLLACCDLPQPSIYSTVAERITDRPRAAIAPGIYDGMSSTALRRSGEAAAAQAGATRGETGVCYSRGGSPRHPWSAGGMAGMAGGIGRRQAAGKPDPFRSDSPLFER